MAAWRTSAAQYASAVQLWGQASVAVDKVAWPPSRDVLMTFCFFFKHGPTLSRYLSHLRSALKLVDCPLGVVEETSALIRGAVKSGPSSIRFKARASAVQTRALAKYVGDQIGRKDIADSFVVARHFCVRYGAEVVCLESAGSHSSVHLSERDGLPVVSLTLYRRKMQRAPVSVVRRCICRLHCSSLCGVCILRARTEQDRTFPGLTYADGLAYLKAAAVFLKFERATEWGTHAFRRGWADEALREGGATALFYSGGWKGLAAFGYASAQTRGALEAAEWLVEFSDSSEGE